MELKTLLCLHLSRTFPVNPFRGEFGRSRGALLAVLFLIAGMAWKVPVAGAQALAFGSINVCPSGATTPAPCSNTLPLTFNIAAGTTIGSINILTTGAKNLDFQAEANDTSTTLCSAQTYSAATTCTVDVTFAPLAPGQRNGAAQILDGSGNNLATTYLYGTGVGPAIAYSPYAQAALGSGFYSAHGVAVDVSGNVFVADTGNNAVKEILAVNGGIPTNPTINILGGGFDAPAGVAVDGSGNVFVADSGNNQVKEILATGGYTTVIALGTPFSFSSPDAVAVDGSGNVFVANTDLLGPGDGAVTEILAVGGYSTVNTIGPGFIAPRGLAVDGSGNVFVTDQSEVKEILAAGGYTSVNNWEASLDVPSGVAVDGSGNVFVALTGNNRVLEIPVPFSKLTLASGLSGGLALNGRGDIFIADHSSPAVLDIQRSQLPPTLIFPNTTVGSSSGPQSIQIQNIGNATLSLSGLSVSENFTLVRGLGTPPDCTAGSILRLREGCNLSINFAPEALGILTGTVTLSDNALNGNPATQTIRLMGEDLPQAQVSTTSLQFATIAFGGATETLPLTITNVGNGTLTIATSINGPSYKITSSTCGAGVTAGNSCTLQVQFSPVAVGGHGDILTLSTNGPSNPTVGLHGVALGVSTEMETPLQFGTIPFGSTEVLLLTINNLGVDGVITIGTTINGPSYKILATSQNTCLAGIRSRQSCTLPVEFDPVSVGNHDDVLTLTPSGVAPSTTVYLHGTAD